MMAVSDTGPEDAISRTPPRDLQRVLLAYLTAALALLCGVPVLIIAWFGTAHCTADGLQCLGLLVFGFAVAAVVAAIALPFIARRFRLGWVFPSLTIALVVAPLMLGDGSLGAGAAFLAPGLAAWVSDPRVLDPGYANPLVPPVDPPSPARHWVPRLVAVAVVSILVPLLGRLL